MRQLRCFSTTFGRSRQALFEEFVRPLNSEQKKAMHKEAIRNVPKFHPSLAQDMKCILEVRRLVPHRTSHNNNHLLLRLIELRRAWSQPGENWRRNSEKLCANTLGGVMMYRMSARIRTPEIFVSRHSSLRSSYVTLFLSRKLSSSSPINIGYKTPLRALQKRSRRQTQSKQ